MKEVEILVKVCSNKKSVLKELKKRFKFKGIERTLDYYFYDPKRNNLRPNSKNSLKEVFRLRKKGNKNFIAYKVDNFYKNGTWKYSDEHETEILDFKIMLEIIRNLGLKPLIKIDNKKYIFLMKGYEIVLEDVKNLGLFMEIEKLNVSNKENVSKVRKEIFNVLNSLNFKISEELNIGKPELMLKSEK